jgi:peroxiredoxin
MEGRRKRLLTGAGVILAAALLGGFLVRSGALRPGKFGGVPSLGQMAPAFELPSLAGDQVSLAGFRGKFVLLGFWASWCPPCREEMSSLENFYREFAGSDLALLAVNVAESRNVVSSFAEKQGITFPVLLDTEARVQKLYGAYQFPVFFLIDRQGRIVERYLGLRDWSSAAVRQELSARIGR